MWSNPTGAWQAALWFPAGEDRFVYDGSNVVLVLGGDNDVTAKYTWGLDLSGLSGAAGAGGLHGAGGIGGLLAVEDVAAGGGASHSYWFFYDANGNVGQLIQASDWSLAAHYEYDPYGNTITSSGLYASLNPYRFSTKWLDAEIDYPNTSSDGLYYYGYRCYTPRLGRWISRDPAGEEGGIHLYAFVTNGAMNLADADGRGIIGGIAKGIPKGGVVGAAAAIIACVSPVLQAHYQHYRGAWTNDKYAHCLVSCRIAKLCGEDVANIAAWTKELRDEIAKRLHELLGELANSEAGFSWDDMSANRVGRECAMQFMHVGDTPPWFLRTVVRWVAGLCGESCHDCCVRRGYNPH